MTGKEKTLSPMDLIYYLKINSSKENFGLYINKYKRYYDRYFSDEIGIKDSLSFEIQKSYENGKGNEFKNGKFYSVGSSSRFSVSCFSENLNGKFFLEDCNIKLKQDI